MPSLSIDLIVMMVERIGLLVGVAFLATRARSYRRLLGGLSGWSDRLWLALIFGLFGIVGTYMGIVVTPGGLAWSSVPTGELAPSDAIANSRSVAVIVAGLVGGPVTGVAAGLLAGTHRFFLGGFTALACAISTTLEGLISGLLRRRLADATGQVSPFASLGVGLAMEALQMAIILLVAEPFEAAAALVRLIGLPMMVVNGLGVAVFQVISQQILSSEAEREGDSARKALLIATRTLPMLAKGLSESAARQVADVIREVTGVSAVAITDTDRILAHVGLAAEHHESGVPIRTGLTRRVLHDHRLHVATSAEEIECAENGCPLRGVVVAPLHEGREVAGTLKLYFDPRRGAAPVALAEGLAYHISTQLGLARADQQAALLARAEIRALQAQIQPHFLFNALNTVMALIRRDADRARDVLGHLGDFIRQNLNSTQQETVTLKQELEHVSDYLAVEEARFGDRLTVTFDADPAVLHALIPPLTLQPLVENAVGHGLKGVRRDGCIAISARPNGHGVLVSVTDNGRGIDPERVGELLDRPAVSQTGSGLALYNVHQRLRGLFGEEAGLQIDSEPGNGTTIAVHLPLNGSLAKEEGP